MNTEVKEKLSRIRLLMKEEGYTSILLTTNENFCWLTGGKSGFVDKGTGKAASKLLVTLEEQYVVCNSSERYRIAEEELEGGEFEMLSYLWNEDEKECLSRYLGERPASDDGSYGTKCCGNRVQRLRYPLTEEEKTRYRRIGLESATILEESCRQIMQGETELEISGRIAGKLMACGYQVPVCLVAADERLEKYRHPIPTERKVEKYAMVAICAQKYGLTVSISRIVSFGKPEEEKKKRMCAVAKVDACYIKNTKAGAAAKEILEKGLEAYRQEGYERDFYLHHQGGALGYATRDYCVNFATQETVMTGQAFAWNPTIAGVKSEDTYLILGDQQEIISHTGKWVYEKVELEGQIILRPGILVKEAEHGEKL